MTVLWRFWSEQHLVIHRRVLTQRLYALVALNIRWATSLLIMYRFFIYECSFSFSFRSHSMPRNLKNRDKFPSWKGRVFAPRVVYLFYLQVLRRLHLPGVPFGYSLPSLPSIDVAAPQVDVDQGAGTNVFTYVHTPMIRGRHLNPWALKTSGRKQARAAARAATTITTAVPRYEF